MFFYRAWAGNEEKNPTSVTYGPEIFHTQFSEHRWGYAALLIITLAASVILNSFFLASFWVNKSKQKYIPHVVFFALSIRDLLVGLVLLPICIDWFIVNRGFFNGSEGLCKFACFFEFFLAAEYPLLLIVLAIILYTRKYPKIDEMGLEMPMDDYNQDPIPMSPHYNPDISGYRVPSRPQSSASSYRNPHQPPSPGKPPSVMGSVNNGYNGHRAPSVVGSVVNGGGQRAPSVTGSVSNRPGSTAQGRAPSVAGSDTGYRQGGQAFRPQRPVMLNNTNAQRPGSVTGSIEGRLAAGRRTTQLQQQSFMTSSPLREEDEDGCSDLWDAASLDYPGNQSPTGWDFLGEEDDHNDPLFYEEPRFHTWHYWMFGIGAAMALALGVPSAMFVEHRPFHSVKDVQRPSRPGCFIPTDPFKNPYSYTVNDPGFNFTMSNIVITYIFPSVILFALILMIYWRKMTDNQKFRRYVKILTFLCVTFFISRSPIDILQLKGIVEAAMGFKQLNVLPYELEYEILLVWVTYLPLLAHPIIYFCLCSEYRQGGVQGIRTMCGCPILTDDQRATLEKYKEKEILESRSTISKTQVSNIL